MYMSRKLCKRGCIQISVQALFAKLLSEPELRECLSWTDSSEPKSCLRKVSFFVRTLPPLEWMDPFEVVLPLDRLLVRLFICMACELRLSILSSIRMTIRRRKKRREPMARLARRILRLRRCKECGLIELLLFTSVWLLTVGSTLDKH